MDQYLMNNFFKYSVIFYAIFNMQLLYAFDHQHPLWHSILQKNVHLIINGTASQVDYKNIKNNSTSLDNYLKLLTSINRDEFNEWSKNEQKSFLINAYNAFTIQLVLSEYPDLDSIKDIGSFFTNPWKKKFFTLLGKKRSLDDLEHNILRKEGVYDDPYIHVALVCASIGCPALRNEAYTAEKIEQQLTDSMQRFLSDKQRNRYNPKSQSLEVSKIFDWYKQDFTQGHRGLFSLNDLFSIYFKELTDNKEGQEKIRAMTIKIDYLDYDWNLNDWQ